MSPPPLLPGVENDDPGNSASPMTTLNGVYELTYFRYALGVAQQWRERRGLDPDPDAAKVLASMCPPRKRSWKNESVRRHSFLNRKPERAFAIGRCNVLFTETGLRVATGTVITGGLPRVRAARAEGEHDVVRP